MYIFVIMAFVLISPVIGIVISVLLFEQKHFSRLSAIIFGTSMALMMYCYIPDSGNDIFRHFISMNSYKNIPLWQCFGNTRFQSGVFTWDLWLWVMARFSNMQLLQASGAFVAYTMLTWMIFDYACLNRLKMKQWITILLIGMTIVPILDIGIGIRYANAFIIAGYAFYRHYIKNVGIIRTIGVLLAAIFLHHAIIPIIVAWVALPFFSKRKGICTLATVALLSLFTGYVQTVRIGSTDTIVGMLCNSVIGTTQVYTSYAVTSFHSLFTRYLQMIFAGALLTRPYVASSKGDITQNSKLWNLSYIVFIEGVSMSFNLGSNGNRFFVMSMILSLIPFAQSIEEWPFLGKRKCSCLDIAIMFCAAGSFALYLYNMNWGNGSLASFLLGGIVAPLMMIP